MNAMHRAAEGGHIEIIKYLLPLFGAEALGKDDNACSMLHWATHMGHCQVARYLIEEVQMDPQDRNKVSRVAVDCWFLSTRSKCHACVICAACCDNQVSLDIFT